MNTITTDQVKELREMTGISVMQCKKALEEADGDKEKALVILRKVGSAVSAKKAGRTLNAGVVEAYIHNTKDIGTMVLLSCETDFVAQNEEFIALARDIAMHATATNPEFINRDDVTEKAKKVAEEVFAKETAGKPDELKAKILKGKLDAYFKDKILLEQEFIKDPSITIKGLIESAIQKFGENIALSNVVRLSVRG